MQEKYTFLFIKWIGAFLIPLGWAAILYPLMKKLRKSWYLLVGVASLFSLFTLVFNEMIKEAVPLFDEILAYGLGIFFGAAVLSFMFNFKTKWLNDQPKDDSFFPRHKVRKKLHLRHIFQMAILIEEKGQEFYYKLADKAVEANLKHMCRSIAQDEAKHKKLFEDTLFRWLPLTADREYLISFAANELRARGIFLNPPDFTATEDDMARYSIDQEKKMADFYISFENSFPHAWKRMHLQQIVMEERKHASDLMTAYPHLNSSPLNVE